MENITLENAVCGPGSRAGIVVNEESAGKTTPQQIPPDLKKSSSTMIEIALPLPTSKQLPESKTIPS